MTKPPNRTMGGGPPSPSLPLDGLHVLLVEDEALVAFDVEDLLFQNGANSVEITSSLAVAEEIVTSRPVNLVLLDVKLSDGCGLTILPLLRKLDIAAVITTGYAGLEVDLHPIVQKPYTSAQLIDAIAAVTVRSPG
jgi:DNA-binding response OmpR family regulator